MKKNRIIKCMVMLFVTFALLLSVTYTLSDEEKIINEAINHTSEKEDVFFVDVSEDKRYRDCVFKLSELEIIEKEAEFCPEKSASRLEVATYLYNLAKVTETDIKNSGKTEFADIKKDAPGFEAVSWAHDSYVMMADDNNVFSPEGKITKEQLYFAIANFFAYADIKVPALESEEAFADSEKVSEFARSAVVALKVAGIAIADEDNAFNPQVEVTRGELALMIYSVYNVYLNQASKGEETVDFAPDAYIDCYGDLTSHDKPEDLHIETNNASAVNNENVQSEANTSENSVQPQEPVYIPDASTHQGTYVNECSPVPLSYFDDALFIGDSVSLSLQYYCASTAALGNAKFLCAGSLSPANAHWAISPSSVHPMYNGEKVLVEDGVALSGARKIYIMLGINSMIPFEGNVRSMKLLVDKILAKSPNAKIILQTVTPMIKNGPLTSSSLNNAVITRFNQRLYEMAKQNGWYYVNVAEAVSDSNGFLRDDYCSDPQSMGIHFNYSADEAWVNYLITHAPNI